MRKLGEELREGRELHEAEQDKTRSSERELLQLHNQVPVFTLHYIYSTDAKATYNKCI